MLLFCPIPLGLNLILESRVSSHGAIGVLRFVPFAGIETGRIVLSQFSMPDEGYSRTAAAWTAVRIGSSVNRCISLSWRDWVVSSNGRHTLRDANQAYDDKTQQRARHGCNPPKCPAILNVRTRPGNMLMGRSAAPRRSFLITDRWIFKCSGGCQLFFEHLHSFEQLSDVVRASDRIRSASDRGASGQTPGRSIEWILPKISFRGLMPADRQR
jgi:hypothetical protein